MKFPLWVCIAVPVTLAVLSLTAKQPPQRVQQFFALFEPDAPFVDGHYEIVPESISTGDTLHVFNGDQQIAVQLCGIEVPEIGRPLGIEARDALRDMVGQGTGRIVMVPASTEEGEFLVAEAFLPLANSEEELHLNSQLVADGLAYVSQSTFFSCPNAEVLLRAEERAKEQALGVWARPVSQNP